MLTNLCLNLISSVASTEAYICIKIRGILVIALAKLRFVSRNFLSLLSYWSFIVRYRSFDFNPFYRTYKRTFPISFNFLKWNLNRLRSNVIYRTRIHRRWKGANRDRECGKKRRLEERSKRAAVSVTAKIAETKR